MKASEIIRYYLRKDVEEAILELARDREVVPKFHDQFGARPQVLLFPADYRKWVREGATSFHASEERWSNPMLLNPQLSEEEKDKLRIGWDLVIDVDTPCLDYAKACAALIIEALKFYGIRGYSIKFSGGSGFHIGIPFEAFPTQVDGKQVARLFPQAARVVSSFLKNMIREHLAEELLKRFEVSEICEKVGKEFEQVVRDGKLDPFEIVEIDTALISSRHLFRMHYSLNEKTWFVSLPIRERDIEQFDPSCARPSEVEVKERFLHRRVKKEEAKQLFLHAYEWFARKEVEEEVRRELKARPIIGRVGKESFPPCILRILQGLADGRKRSLFVLINFLRSLGWDFDAVEAEVGEWNKRNARELSKRYIEAQLNWHRKLASPYLPPNCSNSHYYAEIGICSPDELCKQVKNPLVYALKRRRWITKS